MTPSEQRVEEMLGPGGTVLVDAITVRDLIGECRRLRSEQQLVMERFSLEIAIPAG